MDKQKEKCEVFCDMTITSMPTLLTERLTSLLKSEAHTDEICEKLSSTGLPSEKIVKLAHDIINDDARELTQLSSEAFLTPLMRFQTAQVLRKHGFFEKALQTVLPCVDSPDATPQTASLAARLLTGFWRTDEAWRVCSSSVFNSLPEPPRLLIRNGVSIFKGLPLKVGEITDKPFLNSLPLHGKCFAAMVLIESGKAQEALSLLSDTKCSAYATVIKAISLRVTGRKEDADSELSNPDLPPIQTNTQTKSWLSTENAESVVDTVVEQWEEKTPDYDLFKNHLIARLINPTEDLRETLVTRYKEKIETWRSMPGGSSLPEEPFS